MNSSVIYLKQFATSNSTTTGGDATNSGATNVAALIVAVFLAILQIFLVCLLGFILAVLGILDKGAKRVLNVVNNTTLTPCLIISKVAFSLSSSELASLGLVIPTAFAIISLSSAAVGWTIGQSLRVGNERRNFIVACAMFQNSNSLPIALLQSLIMGQTSLSKDANDTQASELARGLSYLIVFSTLGIIVRWSFGVRLLGENKEPGPSTMESTPRTPIESGGNAVDPFDRDRMNSSGIQETFVYRTRQNRTEHDRSDWENDEGVAKATFKEKVKKVGKSIFDGITPPLWAALGSIIVASIPALQRFIVHLDPLLQYDLRSQFPSSGF